MGISVDYSPVAGHYGQMAFSAGQNLEAADRREKLREQMSQLQKIKQDWSLGQRDLGIKETANTQQYGLGQSAQTIQRESMAQQALQEAERVKLARESQAAEDARQLRLLQNQSSIAAMEMQARIADANSRAFSGYGGYGGGGGGGGGGMSGFSSTPSGPSSLDDATARWQAKVEMSRGGYQASSTPPWNSASGANMSSSSNPAYAYQTEPMYQSPFA